MLLRSFILLLLLVFIGSCTSTQQDPIEKKLPKMKDDIVSETYSHWIMARQGNKCFIYAFPISSYGFYLDRKIHYMMINDKKEIIIMAGLPYKNGSKARLEIASYSFFLETKNEEAWANNEDFIISNILVSIAENKTDTLFVYGEFNNAGSSSIDKYSLEGFKDAWESMNTQCNVAPVKQSGKDIA